MSLRKFLGCVLSVVTLALPVTLSAQTSTPAPAPETAKSAGTTASDVPEGGVPRYIRPETPEQRRERLGTQDDPGPNPDPDTVWLRFGKQYKIKKFDKQWAKYTEVPGFVKPLAAVNFIEELYQENDKYVWVWMQEIEEEDLPTEEAIRDAQFRQLNEEQLKFLESMRGEFTPVEPPKANFSVKFEKASKGLPQEGSWRNSLAVADMNGDGKLDIILPPERAGRNVPAVFTGDGNGGWSYYETKWPNRLNYGSVVAADFNKDKFTDLAFGVHLSGVVIALNDGKGNFRETLRITNFPTRRILARDVDADGWMDVVAISEGPVMRSRELLGQGFTNLRAYMNRNKGETWEGINLAGPKERVSGDWLSSGDFNGDKYPDFVGSNLYFNGTQVVYLSKGKNQYEPLAGGNEIIPYRSYYWANTTGRFSSANRDDAVVAFNRQWVGNLNPKVVAPPVLPKVAGLDRISFAGGTPKRTPIIRWGGERPIQIRGVGSGDFDGDGKQDIIYSRADNRQLNVLFGDGKGGFRQAVVEGVELGAQPHYDLTVADVNGDKRPDVLLMYESESGTSFSRNNGKVDVYLNRGVTRGE
jgi:hypothetical protein